MSPRSLFPMSACALLSLLGGCGADRVSKPDVVLIVVDTLRADRLGALGSERGLTPNLDRFFRENVTFLDAGAHAPWTLPSLASLMTSKLPPEHGAGGSLDHEMRADFRALTEQAVTLPEVLDEEGWRSAAITNVTFLTEAFGVVQGVDEVDAVAFESNLEVRDARATTDAALAWLAAAEEPSFLFVHYFDPHAVYDPPAEDRARFAADVPPDFRFGTRADMAALRRGLLDVEPDTLERAERLYDAEVHFVDRELGRLLGALAQRGNTIVAITADHGEEFGDHGGFEHGHTVYRELLHLPLAISAPGLEPAVVEQPVGLIDVAPTLVELAGIDGAPTFAGSSLVPLARGEMVPSRPLFAEGNMWGPSKASLRVDGWKLITSDQPGASPELYDLANDPSESNDVARTELARLEALEDQLAALRQSFALQRGERTELSDETREMLEALGYMGAGDLEDE